MSRRIMSPVFTNCGTNTSTPFSSVAGLKLVSCCWCAEGAVLAIFTSRTSGNKRLMGRPINLLFPDVLEVKIANTAPSAHQQQDTNFKPATLENGVEVLVPQFVKTGDIIRLDIENLRYMDRAKTRR